MTISWAWNQTFHCYFAPGSWRPTVLLHTHADPSYVFFGHEKLETQWQWQPTCIKMDRNVVHDRYNDVYPQKMWYSKRIQDSTQQKGHCFCLLEIPTNLFHPKTRNKNPTKLHHNRYNPGIVSQQKPPLDEPSDEWNTMRWFQWLRKTSLLYPCIYKMGQL